MRTLGTVEAAMEEQAPASSRRQPRSQRDTWPDERTFFDELLAELREHPAARHPFLRRFSEERLSREQLQAFAIQHYHYSRRFANNLAAALSNTPDEAARTVIILNMYDEVGEPLLGVKERVMSTLLRRGDLTPEELGSAYAEMLATLGPSASLEHYLVTVGLVSEEQMSTALRSAMSGIMDRTHPALFRRFLSALGVDRERAIWTDPLPETARFIETYDTVCRSGHWLEALGAMGPGTECLVPHLYRFIHRGIEISGQLAPEDYEFWTVHIGCDDSHGESLIQAMMRHSMDPESRHRIATGARLVLDARAAWFDGLFRLVFGSALRDEARHSSMVPTRRSGYRSQPAAVS